MAPKVMVVVFAVLLLNLVNQILLLARAEPSEATNEGSLVTDVRDTVFGPYKEALVDKSSIKFEIWWKVRIEDNDDDVQGDIELKTFVNSHGVNWIGFGFTPDGEIANADWFIVWKNHKGQFIYKVGCHCYTQGLYLYPVMVD